jgi:hypothetical protein
LLARTVWFTLKRQLEVLQVNYEVAFKEVLIDFEASRKGAENDKPQRDGNYTLLKSNIS